MMFYKKGDNIYDEAILNEVCEYMGIYPTEEFQDYFVKDTMEIVDTVFSQNSKFNVKYVENRSLKYDSSVTKTKHYTIDKKSYSTSNFYLDNKKLYENKLFVEAA